MARRAWARISDLSDSFAAALRRTVWYSCAASRPSMAYLPRQVTPDSLTRSSLDMIAGRIWSCSWAIFSSSRLRFVNSSTTPTMDTMRSWRKAASFASISSSSAS